MKKLITWLLVTVLLIGTLGSVAMAEATPQYGGVLVVCEQSSTTTFGYPTAMSAATLIRISAPALEGLFRFDKDGVIQPYLVDTYAIDYEKNTLTLNLKQGIQFHDGTPFNAEAVKWNLEDQVAGGGSYRLNFTKIECPSEYTAVLYFERWDNTALTNLAIQGGLMISPTACKANGAEWAKTHPVGTGAYKMESFTQDVEIVYVKNENYWQEGKPYLDGVKIVWNKDTLTREMLLKNGEVDVLVRGEIASLQKLAEAGYEMYSVASGVVPWCLLPNSVDENSPWSNVKVRQAAAHAIDGEAINIALMNSSYVVTNQLAYPGNWAYNEEVVGYPYDIEKSKALLAEAGYPNGFDTVIIYDAKNSSYADYATVLQSMLAEVGINCTLQGVGTAESDSMRWAGQGWDGVMLQFGNAQPDMVERMNYLFMSDQNWISIYRPEELTAAITDAIYASDEAAKVEAIMRADKVMIDDYCLIIPTFSATDTSVANPKVHGTNISSIAPATAWTPEQAWIEQ